MKTQPIIDDAQHLAALREIEQLWGAPVNTPEGDRLNVLVKLVEAYEEKRWTPNAKTRAAMRESEAILQWRRARLEQAKNSDEL